MTSGDVMTYRGVLLLDQYSEFVDTKVLDNPVA